MDSIRYATTDDSELDVQLAGIIEDLELALAGARMMGDYEAQTRISRAIAVLETASDVQPFKDEYISSYFEKDFRL